jgi:hypothetical protein
VNPPDTEQLPDFIYAFQDRQSAPARAIQYWPDEANKEIAYGAQLTVLCNDHPDLRTLSNIDGSVSTFPLLQEWIATQSAPQLCQQWPYDGARPSNHAAVRSDVPVLILVGAFDPVTPVSYAELAAATLSRGRVFVFPAASHGVIGGDACASKIIAAFLAAPDQRPEVGCPDPAQRPDFSPSVNARALRLLNDGDRRAAEQLLEQVQEAQADALPPEYVGLLRSLQQFAAAKELEARIAPIMRRQGT